MYVMVELGDLSRVIKLCFHLRVAVFSSSFLLLFLNGVQAYVPLLSDGHNHNDVNKCFYNTRLCSETIFGKLTETLKNQHLVMIGDSLTRYQYIALVYTLRYGHPVSQDIAPTPIYGEHRGATTWTDFLKFSNDVLAPNEVCDCFRSTTDFSLWFEDRYYHDHVRNISVTYIAMHMRTVQGHIAPDQIDNKTITTGYPHLDAPRPHLWKYRPDQYSHNILVLSIGL